MLGVVSASTHYYRRVPPAGFWRRTMRRFYIGVTMLCVTGICGDGTRNDTLTAWTESNLGTSPESSLDITLGPYDSLGTANMEENVEGVENIIANNYTNDNTHRRPDDDHHRGKPWWKILVPCLIMAVHILATCVFLLWRRNRKLKRNQEALGGTNIHISHGSVLNLAEVEPGKKMVTIYIATKNPSDDPCNIQEDPIYQEIPATPKQSFQTLQNPLYTSGGHHSRGTPSRQRVQLKEEDGSYSLLGLPAKP